MFPERQRAEAGFTLVEVLFALMLLALIMSVFLNVFLSNFSLNTREVQRSAAVRIAEETLETYRKATNYGDLRDPISTTKTVKNVTYTVNSTFCPADAPATMLCSPSAVYIRVEVKNGSEVLQKTDTYYARFGKID